MKLLILGATGKVGRELISQGLARGHEITALVRSPQKILLKDAKLNVVVGSPLDDQILIQTLAGKDAVLSTLGHTDLKESYLVKESAQALIKAMRRSDVKRFMIVSSTLVTPGGNFLTKIPRYLTRHPLDDSAEMEKVVRPTDLDWTIVRLVRLTNKGEEPYRVFEEEPPTVSASISRKTVAKCMLDLVSDQTYFQKTIGISASRSLLKR
jgi:putative NADH-flavin reductase